MEVGEEVDLFVHKGLVSEQYDISSQGGTCFAKANTTLEFDHL